MNKSRNPIPHLEDALLTSRFNIGDYLGEGFRLWKKEAGPFIGFGVVTIIISLMVNIVPFLGMFANQLLIGPALSLGAYIFSYKIYKEYMNPDFGDFFDGFKKASDIIVAYLIYFIAMLICFVPLFISFDLLNWIDMEPIEMAASLEDGLLSWKLLLFVIPITVIALCFMYSTCFIYFYNLSAWQAVKYSFRFILKNFFSFFFFVIIAGLISISGIIGFFIGVVVTMTMFYPMLFASFKGLTQLEKFENRDDGIADVHDALIDWK